MFEPCVDDMNGELFYRSLVTIIGQVLIVINLIVITKFELDPLVYGNETLDQFDVDLHLLNINVWQKIEKVIKPFWKI
jgi:hypothetical protein